MVQGMVVAEEGGAMVVDVPIGVDEIKSYMRIIKEAKARIIGVFGQLLQRSFSEGNY